MTTYQLYLILLGYISYTETVIDSVDNGEMIKSILLELYNRTKAEHNSSFQEEEV